MSSTALATADSSILGTLAEPSTPALVAVRGGRRLLGLDRMRLVAAALMIEGHVFTLAVRPGIRAIPAYGWHDFVHGFTAPMFLFGAGLAFGTTAARRDSAHPGAATFRAIERYVTLILLSYLLHLGRTTFAELRDADLGTQQRVLSVDALACVGISLLVATAVGSLDVTVGRIRASALAIAALVVLTTPLLDRMPTTRLPIVLASLVNHATGSLFPLFPWSGYVFAGIAASALVGSGRRTSMRIRCGGIGIASIGLGIGLRGLGPDWFGPHSFWQASPFFFLARTGVMLVVFALLAGERDSGGVPSVLSRRLTSETLCLYLVHLAVLYGTPVTHGLRRHVEGRLDLVQASALALGLAVFSVLVAWAFSLAKEHHGARIESARRVALVAIVVRFFAAG